ncbi:hypothetical protein D3C76_1131730 [compost metagenome]
MRPVQGDDLFAAGFEPFTQRRTFARMGQGRQASHRQAGADTHHHIGVINRHALAIHRVERTEFIAQMGDQLIQGLGVGACGIPGVANPLLPIQDHAAGALQENLLLFEAGQV